MKSVRPMVSVGESMHLPYLLHRGNSTFAGIALLLFAAPSQSQPPKIDFAHDIVPLLKARCAECHTAGKYKGSFSLDTREDVLKKKAVVPGKSAESELIRRVYLDIVGLLPAPAETGAFLKDTAPDKRQRLVRKLLDENRSYADHWLSFWNDLLRNDYAGTGYIDGGRTQITRWLYTSLLE